MAQPRKTLIGMPIAVLLAIGSTGLALAQGVGQVAFANLGGGVNAPVYDAEGNPIAAPSTYVADLFWSISTNAAMDSLTPIGHLTPFLAPGSYGSGYFFGGGVTLPLAYILTQVRVWNTNYGSTYYEARDSGGEFGFSNLIVVFPSPAPGAPTPLTGLQSFRLRRIPRLSISLTPTNTVLFSWPVGVTSYALQQNSGFEAVAWTTLTNAPALAGTDNELTLPIPQENVFFRLISQ